MTASRVVFFSLGIGVGVLLTAALFTALAAPAEPCDATRCLDVCERLVRQGQLPGADVPGLEPAATAGHGAGAAEAAQCAPETGFCAYDPLPSEPSYPDTAGEAGVSD